MPELPCFTSSPVGSPLALYSNTRMAPELLFKVDVSLVKLPLWDGLRNSSTVDDVTL